MNRKIKEKLKKIGIILCMLLTFISPGYVSAVPEVAMPSDATKVEEELNEKEQAERDFFEKQSGGLNIVDWIANGLVALFLTIPKWMMLIAASAIRAIAGGIASLGGISGETNVSNVWDAINISPEDIIFNEYSITDVNFFDTENIEGPVKAIRENVAVWYYGLRNLAIIMLLAVLLYVGIRMAVAVTGEDRAKYKKMLMNWFVSFALIFVLHYGMLFIINVNDALVEVFDGARDEIDRDLGVADVMNKLLKKGAANFGVEGLGASIAFVMLVGLSFVFLLIYIKRMITIAFLLMISPIITVTYSIDKMGDGKSQALNRWFKEFTYTILIQPFHCLIYLSFIGSTMKLLLTGTISGAILACIFLGFILQAEKIIKYIFEFQARSMPDAMGMVGVLAAGSFLAKMKKDGKSGGGSGGGKEASDGTYENNSSNARNSNPPPQSGNSGNSGSSRGNASSTPSKAGQAAGAVANRVLKGRSGKQFAKDYMRKSASLATKGLFASMGAASGQMGTTATAWMAGGKVASMGDEAMQKHIAKNNEKRLAKSHNDYQKDTGMSDDQMLDITKTILQTPPEAITGDDNYMAYASMIHAQRDIYQMQGYEKDKVNDKVLDTIKNVQSGKIQPKIMDSMRDKRYPN